MNLIIRISIICLLMLFSCNSSKELYRESEANTYPSDNDLIVRAKPLYSLTEDLQFDIELINNTNNDMLIPIRHMKAQMLFLDESVKSEIIISPNYAFDKIKFSKLNNKKRLKIIDELCLPFLDEKNYRILRAKEAFIYACKLDNYSNINKPQKYALRVKFQLTDRIKKYCPKFWSGTVESNLFEIQYE